MLKKLVERKQVIHDLSDIEMHLEWFYEAIKNNNLEDFECWASSLQSDFRSLNEEIKSYENTL